MNFDEQKKEDRKKKVEELKPFAQKAVIQCPQCGNVNETQAKYCEECGHDLSGGNRCPSCNAVVSQNADICEKCGEWLLGNRCKFCYSEIEEGQIFCSECGNPVAGITCIKCGKISFFDFCKECNAPLTEEAKILFEAVKNKPENRELNEFISMAVEDISEAGEKKIKLADELAKMREYVGKQTKKREEKKEIAFFSDGQKKSIEEIGKKTDGEIKRIEEEKARIEEEKARKIKELRAKRSEYFEKMASKAFKNNQEARKYHDAIKPRGTRGWLCNFTNTIHSCPAGCMEPWHGGYWVV